MIASTHVAAGFVAGMASTYITNNRLGRIAAALLTGIASHVLLDAIPHWDYGSMPSGMIAWVAGTECIVVTLVALFILRHRVSRHWPEYLAAGVVGATGPDAKFVAGRLLPKEMARHIGYYGDAFHGHFHATQTSGNIGVATQLGGFLLFLFVLTRFPRREATAKEARATR